MLPVVTQGAIKDKGAAQRQCKGEDGGIEKNEPQGEQARFDSELRGERKAGLCRAV